MSDIVLVQGDTAPTLDGTITDDNGDPLNLTGCTVYLQMRKKDDNRYTINASCAILVAASGTVRYTLGANDLNTPGDYQGQYEVHYGDARIQTTVNLVNITVRRQ